MNCEKAKGILSAYLDDMLEPQLREEVAGHVESCDQCRQVLEDFRRFDAALASDRRIEPPAELHARIFDSPEFAAIMAGQNGERHTSALRRFAGASPGWARGALSAAAVAALVFGSALLIKQGLLHSGTPSARTTRSLAGPTGVQPLAAGARVVYLRGGALWSAPESGPGLAQRLTPEGMHVAAWAVSPDGTRVAYVDARTGQIHVIRSDDQNDTTTAGIASTSASAAVVWSPDSQQIAFTATQPSGATVPRIMNADGTGVRDVHAGSGALRSAPAWSPDSLGLAFAQDDGGAQAVWFYYLPTDRAQALSHADPAHAGASVATGSLRWLPDMTNPTVTWASTDGGAAYTGIFAQSVVSGSAPRRLTPAGVSYAMADFTAAQGGRWLASVQGAQSSLVLLPVTDGTGQVVAAGTPYTHVAWSPKGDAAALVTADGHLALWTPAGGVAAVAGTSGADGVPVWAPDGGHVAAPAHGDVLVAQVRAGAIAAVTRLAAAGGAEAAAFAQDGGLALATQGGVVIYADPAALPKTLDGAPDGGLAWSQAG